MAKYETIMVLSTTMEEETMKATIEKFTNIIATAGTVEKVDEWGKRRLAYPINKEVDGYYVLVDFEAEPTIPAELNRVYGITDGILRSIVIAKEEA
ncbi:30S ribosomal protein S6 [Ruminococcaceae bacterium OttesenSCG-928-N02]|nr:30S ribosomal protein S6 [Ruminococcaceae bacterium OttesenSCG-928-N02]